jgi:glycerol-3-phosphate acyltransferase PlsY
MKNRFGNVTYDSTLTQGLGPLLYTPDTLAHSFAISFEFFAGIEVSESVSASLPLVQTASLTTVVTYVSRSFEDTASASLPVVLSASLVASITYVSRDIDSDSVAAAIPAIQSASLATVVVIHELHDAILSRPEDTIEHTNSWEFTIT